MPSCAIESLSSNFYPAELVSSSYARFFEADLKQAHLPCLREIPYA